MSLRFGRHVAKKARKYTTATGRLAALPSLPDGTIKTFRASAFNAIVPAMLPRGHFASYLAISKWFEDAQGPQPRLNTTYLATGGGAATTVPLEVTSNGGASADSTQSFTRIESPLSSFLDFIAQKQDAESPQLAAAGGGDPQIYLAQCSLTTLPARLQADLPTPELVARAGRGDVYDSSIWLGLAPTYTPLHRDPNPNLFVQLAGRKAIRMFEPAVGAELFHEAQRRVGSAGTMSLSPSSASFRGEEMMAGPERVALEELVWKDDGLAVGFEAIVASGDCVYIPKGWWHSIRGLGEGIVGSVNWWFR